MMKSGRHAVVGGVLAAVAGIAMANDLGYVGAPDGSGDIQYLETRPVLRGDLGDVVVISTRLAPDAAG